ncbi:MAG: type II secretion system protein [Erysipelotrichaceae bacterium]|nr:type II secretion system protein [Erysipelotrichaceae bacterium]
MNKMIIDLKNKIKSKKGTSLTELLVAIAIMLIVSSILVAGVMLAQRQFIKSIRTSEAQTLYGVLEEVISNELRYTTECTLNNNNEVESFFSVTYAIKSQDTSLVTLDESGAETTKAGYLALGNKGEYNRLLSGSMYPHDLKAKASVKYVKDDAGKVKFVVDLLVAYEEADIVSGQFEVKAINLKQIKDPDNN